MNRNDTSRRLTIGVVILIILCLCLCVTSFALAYSTVIAQETNVFTSGYVSINLNNGEPVIEENEFIFEPGMTVRKDFFIKNNSTDSVYYKIYFDNVEGDLAEVMQIEIAKGDKILYKGTANSLNKSVLAADDELAVGEKRELTLTFYFPTHVGNDVNGINMHGKDLTFDLRADAVQTRNNPNRIFD